MWEATLPPEDANLRQGDLLKEVPLPNISKSPEIESNGRPNFKIKKRTCLVVSQCCTVQERRVVQVASVHKTMPLAPESPLYQALRSDWPAREGQLMYDAMRLDPVAGVLDPPDEGQLWVAEFRTGLTFTENPVWLRAHRVARMTVIARRSLRLRLAGFYSRPTDEDRAELDDVGEWSGLSDAPPWVTRPRS